MHLVELNDERARCCFFLSRGYESRLLCVKAGIIAARARALRLDRAAALLFLYLLVFARGLPSLPRSEGEKWVRMDFCLFVAARLLRIARVWMRLEEGDYNT